MSRLELASPIYHSSPAMLPIVAMTFSADPPATADDYIEDRIDLSEYLTPKPDAAFLIRVDGDSMVDAGIYSGDLLVIERGAHAKKGDIVIVLVGGQLTVKRFRGPTLWPVPTDNNQRRQETSGVWGIVRFVIHRL